MKVQYKKSRQRKKGIYRIALVELLLAKDTNILHKEIQVGAGSSLPTTVKGNSVGMN